MRLIKAQGVACKEGEWAVFVMVTCTVFIILSSLPPTPPLQGSTPVSPIENNFDFSTVKDGMGLIERGFIKPCAKFSTFCDKRYVWAETSAAQGIMA